MAKRNNVKTTAISVEPLVLMASMYDEYLYLDAVFVQKHQCLFGVKAELYNTVKADIDAYEGAYTMYQALRRRYHKELVCNSRLRYETRLLEWGELLYGEERWTSDKEREDYGIKKYKPKYYTKYRR